MKLEQKYLLLKGIDYQYRIFFERERFPGFSLLDHVFTNKELDEPTQQMTIIQNGINFKAVEFENGLLFKFGEDVENAVAYDIMLKLSDDLRHRWVKTALYFVENTDDTSHLIY